MTIFLRQMSISTKTAWCIISKCKDMAQISVFRTNIQPMSLAGDITELITKSIWEC